MKTTITILLLIVANLLYSQELKKSLNINSGLILDQTIGQYFSAELELPVFKKISIVPIFSYYNHDNLNKEFIMFTNNTIEDKLEIQDATNHTKSGAAIDIILAYTFTIKKNHFLKIGTGLGFKHIKYNDLLVYESSLNNKPTTKFKYRKDNLFGLYYLKLAYKYNINNNLYAGLNLGINDLNDEVITSGINLGVYF